MPTPAALPFEFGKDSTNVKGGALVDSATGSPKWWRGRGLSGDYAGAEVLLYDAAGNALLGQKAMAGSVPVVLASDQAAIPVTPAADPLGANADAVVAAGASGSISAKLRAISRDLVANIVLAAGSAIIGKVGIDQTTPGTTDRVTVGGTTTILQTPTISTSPAYTAGDNVGAKITLASAVRVSGGTGIIQSIVLTDKGKQSAATDVVFFSASPTNTTATDNTAQTIHDTDLLTIIGVVSITATDYVAFVDNSVAAKLGLGLAFKAVGSTSIYAILVTRGTPTYTATTDLQLGVTILQD